MKDIYQRIYETGIIPVIKIEDAENAVPLAKALINGGLPCAEVTFRTAAAEEAIAIMAKEEGFKGFIEKQEFKNPVDVVLFFEG